MQLQPKKGQFSGQFRVECVNKGCTRYELEQKQEQEQE